MNSVHFLVRVHFFSGTIKSTQRRIKLSQLRNHHLLCLSFQPSSRTSSQELSLIHI